MTTHSFRKLAPLTLMVVAAGMCVWSVRTVRSATEMKILDGGELFTREWLPNDYAAPQAMDLDRCSMNRPVLVAIIRVASVGVDP